MLTPIVLKIRAKNLATLGITAGGLYAWATVGSLAGALIAGFYLVPTFPVRHIINILGFSLVFLFFITLVLMKPFKRWMNYFFIPLFFSFTAFGIYKIVQFRTELSVQPSVTNSRVQVNLPSETSEDQNATYAATLVQTKDPSTPAIEDQNAPQFPTLLASIEYSVLA